MGSTKEKSDDKPVNLNKGDTVTFDFTEFIFSCENETEFLKYFFKQRAIYDIPRSHPHETPWNYAFHIIEDKYNNSHIIEYNVIHDVVLESSDAGAIYAGRSWNWYGNIIRYNCLYNIGSADFAASGIYFDDALSGQSAYGNLLVNIYGYGFLLGGGRDLEVTNNVLINTGVPFLYDNRAINGIKKGGWFSHANTPGEGLWATLTEYDVNSEPWKSAYPTLSELSDDFSDLDNSAFAANPSNSNIENNIIVNGKKSIGDISKSAKKYSTVDKNMLYTFKSSPFVTTVITAFQFPITPALLHFRRKKWEEHITDYLL